MKSCNTMEVFAVNYSGIDDYIENEKKLTFLFRFVYNRQPIDSLPRKFLILSLDFSMYTR